MISSACEQAVNRALKVQASVSNKRRKIHINSTEYNADDLQQQVDQLKLYRDKTNQENSDSDDSSSSSDSDPWKGCPEENSNELFSLNKLNKLENSFSLRDLLVGKFLTKKTRTDVLSPIVFLTMKKKPNLKKISHW